MTHEPDPKDALARIQAARSSVVRTADYPVGYDIAYGGVCALLVAGQGCPARGRSSSCRSPSAVWP